MKMFFLIYDVDLDEDIMETLSTCCVTGYTKWDRVLGKGERSNPKMDDAVWPGFNSAVVLAVEKEMEEQIFEALTALHKKMGEKAIKVFSWPLDRVI